MNYKRTRAIVFICVIVSILTWLVMGDIKMDRSNFLNINSSHALNVHARIILSILLSGILAAYLFLELSRDRPGLSFFKIFRQNPQPMWMFDIKTLKFLVVNEAASSHYGYSKAEFYKLTLLQIRPPEDIEQYRELNKRTIDGFPFINRGFSNDQTVWRHCKKNGDIIYVKNITFYTQYLGRKVALVTILDITDSYLQEKKVKEQKELLDALINSTDDFIWAVDKNLVPTASNSSYQRFIREITGLYVEHDVSNILIRYATDFMELQKEYYIRALKGEKINTEREFNLENFALIYLELKFNPVELNGEIVGAVCFARNISERKRYTSKIERQIKVLKEIAVLSSHDIRRPVSSILGLLDLVDTKNPNNTENYQILEYLRLAANELDSMIFRIVERCTNEINLDRERFHSHEEDLIHSRKIFTQVMGEINPVSTEEKSNSMKIISSQDKNQKDNSSESNEESSMKDINDELMRAHLSINKNRNSAA